MNTNEKYLEVLKSMNRYVTVSEWAFEVGETYPDLLAAANEQALKQKNETTGLREIAARISSQISRQAFADFVHVDDRERPKRIKYLSKDESEKILEEEKEEDLAQFDRDLKIRNDFKALSTRDKYRIAELRNIVSQLRSLFELDFEFEHSKALGNDDPGMEHPDNIQILVKSHNRKKSKSNWIRFTIDEQIQYLKIVVELQKIVAKKMEIDLDENVIESIITRLKAVY